MTTDGNRTLTVQPNGTKVYTPFPDYEETVPVSGGATKRVTFSLAGQLIAVRVITDSSNTYYYAYTDHLGDITGWSDAAGVYLSNSIALHEPFGAYRFRPPASVNPGISDRGFTGHRMNNSATNDLGLIYMNARYYLPEVGRFISADTIVPEPANPQSYNRYAYGYNNPVKYVDPSGHDAVCSVADSNGNYSGNCDEWMMEAIRILGLEGGLEGARLAEFFWQWFNDPGKMLRINAFYVSGLSMFTRQLSADTATISIDMNAVLDFEPNVIALLGHELEHVSQGTWQAWSIHGEVLAYQVEFRIREAMGINQSPLTNGAMGRFEGHSRAPYDANSYADLLEARKGFLSDPRVGVKYDTLLEPNLPWGQEIGRVYVAGLGDMIRSLNVDYLSAYSTLLDR